MKFIIKYNFLLIPLCFILIYISLYFTNLMNNTISFYYVPISVSTTTMSILHRFKNIVFMMHTKPMYVETTMIFKYKKSIDSPDEIDRYLTTRFKDIFCNSLIIVDSVLMGFLTSWGIYHLNINNYVIDYDIIVKNIGMFGGYVSLCGKIHSYIGKVILFYVNKTKECIKDGYKKRKNSMDDEDKQPIK